MRGGRNVPSLFIVHHKGFSIVSEKPILSISFSQYDSLVINALELYHHILSPTFTSEDDDV